MLARRGCGGAFGASSKQAPAGGNLRMVTCPASFGPSSTDRSVQAQLEQVLTIQHEMQKSQAQLVTDVSKIKEDVTQLKLDSAQLKLDSAQQKLDSAQLKVDVTQLKLDSAQLKVDVTQLKLDNAVNRALVAANFFPAAALVLGVLYFVYSNFRISNV